MKIFITGISGMDGSILANKYLQRGDEVHGMIRRCSTFNTSRIDDLMESDIYNKQLFLHHGDMTDSSNLGSLIADIKPDIVLNMAAQSHVKVSFEVPEYTAQTDGVGVLRILDAICKHSPKTRFYQASSSEQYGGVESEMPPSGYNENSPFHPRSPYAAAKLYAYWITKNYREAYGLFASNGILFNHEAPLLRGPTFVTRKITMWMKKFMSAVPVTSCPPLRLGNLYAKRDWGHADDYCDAIMKIMDHDKPGDWVVATGHTHTVKEFIEECFKLVWKEVVWIGNGKDEIGVYNGQRVVEIDPRYFRPTEVDILLGDSTKIRSELGWEPKFDFKNLVKHMLYKELHWSVGGKIPEFRTYPKPPGPVSW